MIDEDKRFMNPNIPDDMVGAIRPKTLERRIPGVKIPPECSVNGLVPHLR